MSSDLIEFLRARLDEDERWAKAAAPEWDDEDWHSQWQDLPDASFGHARAHDPARVLREVEAKRLILTEYEKESRVMEKGHRTSWTEGGQAARSTVLKAFAAVYADHPDYRQEWRK